MSAIDRYDCICKLIDQSETGRVSTHFSEMNKVGKNVYFIFPSAVLLLVFPNIVLDKTVCLFCPFSYFPLKQM